MFNPIGNFAAPGPLTLVATALPNAIALRVPYDNISPSVSSPEVSNNARGNRTPLPKAETAQNIAVNISTNDAPAASNDNVPKYSSSAQTAFLAQLAAGDSSPEVNGIFLQYEKLLSYANVKYKPSNAGKPVDPIGIFKTLLQMEKEAPTEPVEIRPEPKTETTIETLPPREAAPVPEFSLPQLQTAKYIETISRNNETKPTELEVA